MGLRGSFCTGTFGAQAASRGLFSSLIADGRPWLIFAGGAPRPTQVVPDMLDLARYLDAQPGVADMAMTMPVPDQAVLERRETIVAALRAIVPGEGVIDTPAEMLPYESDGLMAYRQPPMVVVLPDTTEQVSKVLR